MKLKIVAVLLILISLYALVFILTSKSPKAPIKEKPVKQQKLSTPVNSTVTKKQPVVITKEQLKKALEDQGKFIKVSVDSLRKKFGETISDVKQQLKLIRFRNFIKKHYPENWEELFKKIISTAFPDEAKRILRLIERMDQYNNWLATGERFSGMSYLEMKRALTDIRLGFFGEDAAKIWSEDSKIDKIRDTIALLDKSSEPIDEKLKIFKETLEEEFVNEKETLVSRKYNLATSFFNMDSVQAALKKLNPTDRLSKLSEIRKEIGYSENEISIMAKRDVKRDKRWENGLKYTRERDALKDEYSGEELEEKLSELRNNYFGHEAKTIGIEEKSGFFRYNRKRVYGRN